MPAATEHLRNALRAMIRDRDELNRQIKVVERTLNELEGADTSAGASDPRPVTTSSAVVRPVSQIVGDLLRQRDIVSLNEIMEALRAEGNQSRDASVSSILSRMIKQGLIAKGPRRGTFTLAISPDEAEIRQINGLPIPGFQHHIAPPFGGASG